MKRRGAVLVMLLVFVALAGGALAHVTLRLRLLRLGYQISERSRAGRELEEENRRLRLERSALRNPARIEELARGRLRMIPPPPDRVRVARSAARLAAALPVTGDAERPEHPEQP